MIVIYKTIPNRTIKAEAKKAIPQIEKWFKDHPDRNECNAQTWYGKMFTFHRDNVTNCMNLAVAEAVKDPCTFKKLPKLPKTKKAKKAEKTS